MEASQEERLEEGEFLHTKTPKPNGSTHNPNKTEKKKKTKSIDTEEIASFPLIDEEGRAIPHKNKRGNGKPDTEYNSHKNTCVNASITLACITASILMIVLFILVARVENFHELSQHTTNQPNTSPSSDDRKNLIVAQNGAVAADSDVCSKVGVSMLTKGGNAGAFTPSIKPPSRLAYLHIPQSMAPLPLLCAWVGYAWTIPSFSFLFFPQVLSTRLPRALVGAQSCCKGLMHELQSPRSLFVTSCID